MNKTMTGILVVVAFWMGAGASAYGSPLRSKDGRPEYLASTGDSGAKAKDGSGRPQLVAPDMTPRAGLGAGLVGRPWSAALKVVTFNLSIGSFNAFVMDRDYAKISLDSILRNLRTAPWFDEDTYGMNCFMHPFHGSMYFNFARSSGLSFWQSAPYSLLGSVMWEVAMETEPISINDLFFTTAGGIYLGESLHRISSRIVDGRARGLNRFGRELLGAILNPADALTRLLNGQMFRYYGSPGEAGAPFQATVVIGRTGAATPWGIFQSGGEPFVSLTFRAGDPFTDEEEPGAFDFFVHRSRFQAGKKFSMDQAGYGYLGGARFLKEDGTGHVLGFFLDFDYRMTESVRLAAPSIAGGWVSRFRLGNGVEARTTIQVGAMMIGACSNPYSQVSAGLAERGYDFGSGLAFKGEERLSLGTWGTFELGLSHHILYVLKGSSGVDRVTFFEARYDIPVYGAWTIGLEYAGTLRDSDYRDDTDVRTGSSDLRMIAGVGF
jgi:hypothetical protein